MKERHETQDLRSAAYHMFSQESNVVMFGLGFSFLGVFLVFALLFL